jgi:ubiquinone/menaquinone biosynthesis C-methylase UbiE
VIRTHRVEDRVRRAYYDRFSRFYDRFVDMHSRDTEGLARKFLADKLPVQRGGMVLDLCTGTAALVPPLQAKVGPEGRVVGLDFSHGMLKVGRKKVRCFANVHLVEADAGSLPFLPCGFDMVTCSHAFYELKGETRHRVLREIVRVLKPTGTFLMMEHDVPTNPFVRTLFYLRLTFIGGGRATTFLRHEREVLEQYFGNVDKIVAPVGRSKVMVCQR